MSPTEQHTPTVVDGRPAWFPRRRVARWLVGVVVAVALAELVARLVVPATSPEIRWYDAATQLRVEMMHEVERADVVFAGTSSAWQAFVPDRFSELTGRTSFNVGLAGAVPVVSGRWLVDEVTPRLGPDTVVWGFTALDFASGYGSEQRTAYERAVATDDRWLARLDRTLANVSELVRSRRLLRSTSTIVGPQADERRRLHDEARADTGDGGVRIDFGPASADDLAVQRSRLADFRIDPDDVDAVREATRSLRADGVRVVFVELPVPTVFRDLLAPRSAADVTATVRSLGVELGVDVVGLRDVFADA
ncbi:MAG: hypothetical protein ACLGHQ_01110, partial [Acidimicrobiia bacterium]